MTHNAHTPTHVLQPMTLPIQGTCLIEASAGTGKTYTLAALYLRLVLGIHPDSAPRAPLGVEEILVVTFTEAATQELRDRIRARIQAARTAFIDQESDDPFIAELLAACPQDKYAEKIKLLQFAATAMDQAAIFTIHGFCQRMLSQHAFESGSLFEQELVTDDTAILFQAVYDFWRDHYYRSDIPSGLAAEMLTAFKEPKELLFSIRRYLSIPNLKRLQQFEASIFTLWQIQQAELQAFVQSWQQLDLNLFDLIQSSGINKRSYRKDYVEKWLNKIHAFAGAEESFDSKRAAPVPWDALGKLTQSLLNEKTPDDKIAPQHPIFEQIEALIENRVPVKEVLISQALDSVQARLTADKSRKNIRTFDDLLSQLAAALYSQDEVTLSRVIRSQYPVAMIDEFQDTDPLQYDIFRSIYQSPDAALLMIGDPKQSIYAFRGGDIFTYMAARQNATAHFTLDTNWRSSKKMITAVNQLFDSHPDAFIYSEQIPFDPVNAAGKADKTPFAFQGEPHAALNFWQIDACNQGDYQKINAAYAANQIAALLSASTENLQDENSQYSIGDRGIKPSDIAVLVRDRNEAAQVQQALSERGVSSVFMSNRESVFATVEATELLQLLRAIQEPTDERLTRTAMATALMQQDSLMLDQLFQDEMQWEALVEELQGYRQQWLYAGVLPMLHTLLMQRKLTASLLNSRQGERRLTDLLHLGELLQHASLETDSLTALIHWFEEQIDQPSSQTDAQQLRLESDSDRVTVITIHKSKGLEYNLVFLPFICRFREDKSYSYHNAQGERVFDLDLDDEAKARVEKERLAEDLRLLYVALTRAVYGCYVGVADLHYRNSKKPATDRSALGYLLMQGRMLAEGIAAFVDTDQPQPHSALLAIESIENRTQTALLQAQAADGEFSAKVFNGSIDSNWRLTSYSALSRHASHQRESLITPLDLEAAGDAVLTEDHTIEPSPEPLAGSIHAFPKGAVAGTFLHTLFELVDFSTVTPEQLQDILQQQLPLNGFDAAWQPMLVDFMQQALEIELSEAQTRLRDITQQNRMVEMEFVLPFQTLQSSSLNALLQSYDPLAAQAGDLVFEQIKGMLKGYIDLTMRVGERYFVLDYKSNWLGPDSSYYTQEAMQQAMIDHRYDLQYVLYTLALHRLLKSRIADYDYDQHIGGVYYVFLRGLQPDETTGVFFTKPEKALIDALDRMFGAAESGTELGAAE